MDKATYMRRFSWMARWGLTKPQAEEAIADYEEILSQRGEGREGALVEELGSPFHAAKLLIEPKAYFRWLGVLAVMLLSVLTSEILLLWGSFRGYPFLLMCALQILGLGTALLWSQGRKREEQKRGPVPKGLFLSLAGVLILAAAAGAVMWMLATVSWDGLPARYYGLTARWTLCIAGTVSAALGVFGLIKARVSDRRWCSLFILGLTVVVECVLVAAILTSMSLDTAAPDWWVSYTLRMGVVGAVGLAGAGVALC